MSNFLDFIKEDIDAKKTLLDAMPSRTKPEKTKYNKKVDSISKKYDEYSIALKKYIELKNKKFLVKKDTKGNKQLKEEIENLEQVHYMLNPLNSFYEKLGLDNLMYEISNYHYFNFGSLITIINTFLDKFEEAGISLTEEDFSYTCYIRQYMKSFLEARRNSKDYDMVSKTFEKIYWVNPEIIEHIELNFKYLIKKHTSKFEEHIVKVKKDIMTKNSITDYNDCYTKLMELYHKQEKKNEEDVSDIIKLSNSGEIDINHYFEDSKICLANFESLLMKAEIKENKSEMQNFYSSLMKLKSNIKEYSSFLKFVPLVKEFKNQFEKDYPTYNKKEYEKRIKEIDNRISTNEKKLFSINKKIYSDKTWDLDTSSRSAKNAKVESIIEAKKIYDQYKELDEIVFRDKVLSQLSEYYTVSDLLKLIYSFDNYKKEALRKAFDLENYEDILTYSNELDAFALSSETVIIDGINLFVESEISQTIMTKYRLYNINITTDDLEEDMLEETLSKIEFILRINTIEQSKLNCEKILFIREATKINKK